MKVYNVSYDLNKSGQDYESLIKEIKSSPGWAHPLKSTWLIATNETADTLCERLRKHMDSNDYILVIRATRDYQGWLPEDIWTWINEHVTECASKC